MTTIFKVFISCFNAKYPDFKWDDDACVPPEWRWGDPDPVGPADATWVRKYALLLLYGSGPVSATPMPYKVTHMGGGCKLIVERPADAPPIEVGLWAGEWIGVVHGDTILPGFARKVPPDTPKEDQIDVNGSLKHMGKSIMGCTIVRSIVRPPRNTKGEPICGAVPDTRKKLLAGGVASLDATALFDLLSTPEDLDGFRSVLESLPDGARVLTLLRAAKDARNKLAGHLIGGSVPTIDFNRMVKAVLDMIEGCQAGGLITADHSKRWTADVREVASYDFRADRYELLEILSSDGIVDAARKGQARIKRLTEMQWRLFHDRILGTPEPRLLVQSPTGSGKTLLCQHLALRFLVGRLASPTDTPRRFLLLTHSAALAKVCADYIESVAREPLGIPLQRVDGEGGTVEFHVSQPAPPTEISVMPVDVLVSAVTGVTEPAPEVPATDSWRRDMLARFDVVVVDEGHLVFSHQPRQHLDGQHLLRNCNDLPSVVEAVTTPHARITVFHDEDYQSDGVRCSYPTEYVRVAAGLAMVRCPGSVRDASVPYAQSLCDEAGVGREAMYVPLLDERHKGPDVELIDVKKPVMWCTGYGTSLRSRSVENVLALVDTSGSGVLAFAQALENTAEVNRNFAIVGATTHYSKAIDATLSTIAQQHIQPQEFGWGDVAVLLPGGSEVLTTKVLTACRKKASHDIRDGLASATSDPSDLDHMYFGSVENFAGLERAIVIVTGFWHPLALLDRPPQQARASAVATRQ